MTVEEFRASVSEPEPPQGLSVPLAALWWDAKGDWARAHGWWTRWRVSRAWPFMRTCIAKRVMRRTRSIGIGRLGGDFIGRSLGMSGRRWSRGYCPSLANSTVKQLILRALKLSLQSVCWNILNRMAEKLREMAEKMAQAARAGVAIERKRLQEILAERQKNSTLPSR